MISALVLAAVMFVIALDVGWIARLGAALAGRVGQAMRVQPWDSRLVQMFRALPV